MSQIDFIRRTVSDFFDALTDSELADNGNYFYPPTSTDSFPCRVLLRRSVKSFGDFGRAPGQAFEIRIVNEDIPVQRRGAIIAIDSATFGTEQFELVEKVEDNGALTTWSVTRA